MLILTKIKEARAIKRKTKAFGDIYRRGGFPYEYEGEVKGVDAFDAYQKMLERGVNRLQDIFNGFLQDDRARTQEFQKLMEEVFDVKPFDGKRGMTLHEMYIVVSDFFRYLDGLKKNYFHTQGSPLSTVTVPPTERSTENGQPEEEKKD